MVVVAPPRTKADLRRAVIRTAARAHARHDRTGLRAIAAGSQDNDGWASERDKVSTIAFARQQASTLPCAISVPPAGHTPCVPPPETTLTGGMDRCPSAPAGAAAGSASRSRASVPQTDVAAASALSFHSLHNGGNTDV